MSTVFGSQAFEGVYQPLRYAFVLLVPLFVFFNYSHDDLLYLVKGFVLGAAVFFGLGSFAYISNFDVLVGLDWVSASRLSFWFNPNSVGTISVFSLFFGVVLFFVVSGASRWFWLLSSGMMLLPLFFSMSFGSIALAVMSFIVFFLGLLLSRRVVPAFVIGSVAVVSALVVVLGFPLLDGVVPDRFSDRVLSKIVSGGYGEEGVGSADVRLEYNRFAFDAVGERPFMGYGLNSREELGFYPHSTPVLMLLEGGVVALGLWLIIVFTWVLVVTRGLVGRAPLWFKLMAVVSLASWLFLNVRVPHMYQSYFYVPLFLSMALLYSGSGNGGKAVVQQKPDGRRGEDVVGLVSVGRGRG